MNEEVLQKRQKQVLYDKKWIKFLRRTWLFKYIPFVDFAIDQGEKNRQKIDELLRAK